MKKVAICFSLFTNILFAQDSTLVKGVFLPELMVLYTNWDNKIVPFVEGEDSLFLEIEGATATPKTWSSYDGNKFNGYYVNVPSDSRRVSVKLKGLNKNLDTINYGEYLYKVKPFPRPAVQGGTISKSCGTKVIVSLGPDNPFTGVNFTVTGGEISVGNTTTAFSGDRISSDFLMDASPGNIVFVDVFYTRNGIKCQPISAKLRVVY